MPSLSIEELKHILPSAVWSTGASSSIEIDAPIAEVWAYVSDSANAHEWSSYFDHISVLPGPYPDGAPGSVRRCYRNPNERGPRWDELTVEVEPFRRRLIYSYHFIGFLPAFVAEDSMTYVEQLYEALTPERTRLTFRTTPVPTIRWITRLMLKAAKSETVRLFEVNQANIKAAVEARRQKKQYVRPFAWEQPPASIAERLFSDQHAS